MSLRQFILTAVAAVSALLGCPISAAANQLAASTMVNVRSGPGTEFTIVGRLLHGDVVTELRCNANSTWCEIQSASLTGWVAAQYLEASGGGAGVSGFMQYDPFVDRPGLSHSQRPMVCFYDEPSYAGRERCSEIGDGHLRLNMPWSNAIRSLRVSGDILAVACTEPDMRGTCATISRSVPDLGLLSGQISSYRIEQRR